MNPSYRCVVAFRTSEILQEEAERLRWEGRQPTPLCRDSGDVKHIHEGQHRRIEQRQAGWDLPAPKPCIAQQDRFTITHETIIMALQQVQHGWVYAGQAARIIAETAERMNDEPEKVALYRAAIVSLARMAEESERDP